MINGEPMLAATDIVGGYGKVQILNGITLKVARGQIAALLGGNGTGKSTMLKALSGLIKPWSGSIVFDGEPIEGLRPDLIVRRGLVQVTQGKEAYPAMTVEENLLLGSHVKPDRATRARGLERAYGYFPVLKERRRQLTGTLSGGQLQMLCVARGLMSEPKMMLLDEPSAALAPQVVLDIFRAIGRICRDGMTLLLVEQNVAMALDIANRAYLLEEGRIVAAGSARELREHPDLRRAFLGAPDPSSREEAK